MSFQCYYHLDYTNPETRCKNIQEDNWCNEEHKKKWQEENYIDKRPRQQRQLDIKEIQIRLLQMAQNKKEERFKTQQKLI